MKYLKLYEDKYLDQLLDKINKSGYDSLSDLEKNWLVSHSKDEFETKHKIEREIGKRNFVSSDNYFTFDFIEMEDYGDEQIYKGTLYTPSIEWENGNKIEGELQGQIEVRNNIVLPNFSKEEFGQIYDVYEFCQGLEYELDAFLQHIVEELNEE
jgi:hypothetical protein